MKITLEKWSFVAKILKLSILQIKVKEFVLVILISGADSRCKVWVCFTSGSSFWLHRNASIQYNLKEPTLLLYYFKNTSNLTELSLENQNISQT